MAPILEHNIWYAHTHLLHPFITYTKPRLLVICNYHNRSDLMKLMITTLDCAHDVKSRVILSKVLTSTDPKMRLYATKHMRILLRSKMPFFNSWGLEMLIYQVINVPMLNEGSLKGTMLIFFLMIGYGEGHMYLWYSVGGSRGWGGRRLALHVGLPGEYFVAW